jgi:hypothetical protein
VGLKALAPTNTVVQILATIFVPKALFDTDLQVVTKTKGE